MSSFKNFAPMLSSLQDQADGKGTIAGSPLEDFLSIAGYEDPAGGGGGGDFKTAVVTLTTEKLYCTCDFYGYDNDNNSIALGILDDTTQYLNYKQWDADALTDGVTANITIFSEAVWFYPYYDLDNPEGLTLTGDASWDAEKGMVKVTGDCTIHVVGFDDGV